MVIIVKWSIVFRLFQILVIVMKRSMVQIFESFELFDFIKKIAQIINKISKV
jgi:hypothetical protein